MCCHESGQKSELVVLKYEHEYTNHTARRLHGLQGKFCLESFTLIIDSVLHCPESDIHLAEFARRNRLISLASNAVQPGKSFPLGLLPRGFAEMLRTEFELGTIHQPCMASIFPWIQNFSSALAIQGAIVEEKNKCHIPHPYQSDPALTIRRQPVRKRKRRR